MECVEEIVIVRIGTLSVHRKVLLASLIAILAMPTPAGAFHEDALPLVTSGGTTGHGWTAFKLTADGGKLALDIGSIDGALPNQSGLIFYDGNDQVLFGFTLTAVSRGKDGVYVRTTFGPGFHHDDLAWPAKMGFTGMGLSVVGTSLDLEYRIGGTFYGRTTATLDNELTDDLKILVWTAGQQASWYYELRGGMGIDVVRDEEDRIVAESGDSTFVYSLEDLSGPANVQAFSQGAGIRAGVQLEKVIEIKETLVGGFSAPTAAVTFAPGAWVSADLLTVTGPNGSSSCPCSYWNMAGPAYVAGPGTYTFALTGAGVVVGDGINEIFFGGADVRLPE